MINKETIKKLCENYPFSYDVVISILNEDYNIYNLISEMIFQVYAPLEEEKTTLSIESNNLIDIIKNLAQTNMDKNEIKSFCNEYIKDLQENFNIFNKDDLEKLDTLINATVETI